MTTTEFAALLAEHLQAAIEFVEPGTMAARSEQDGDRVFIYQEDGSILRLDVRQVSGPTSDPMAHLRRGENVEVGE